MVAAFLEMVTSVCVNNYWQTSSKGGCGSKIGSLSRVEPGSVWDKLLRCICEHTSKRGHKRSLADFYGVTDIYNQTPGGLVLQGMQCHRTLAKFTE